MLAPNFQDNFLSRELDQLKDADSLSQKRSPTCLLGGDEPTANELRRQTRLHQPGAGHAVIIITTTSTFWSVQCSPCEWELG